MRALARSLQRHGLENMRDNDILFMMCAVCARVHVHAAWYMPVGRNWVHMWAFEWCGMLAGKIESRRMNMLSEHEFCASALTRE